ncbi:Dynamin family protein [Methanofollis aquaemaris]|uniref:Dynamin family protein n=1 Tax=Methanofollis aquaemaris TaxID=126734 RepID=A0A8A3S272_9EURY|nr:dynamin family protein [Methanofollis aquaemaris]QSZ66232.1 Dynamin family protein [Methanofollis aquaemaris]
MQQTLNHEGAPASPRRPETLERAIACVRGLGPDYARYETRLLDLADRLDAGRFHLAVLGQFKRGKSTLLNALIGEDVLPRGVVPLTAVPTVVTYGARREVRVRFEDEGEEKVVQAGDAEEMRAVLLEYVAEDRNPGNEKHVASVEVVHPAPLLEDVVLIDTPGIGSTHRHNTETTLALLPRCDAALFLLSADPPITEVEVGFLREVRHAVPRLFFLLNKVDYLSEDEQETAVAFLREVLAGETGEDGEDLTIFSVSARTGLRAREEGDEEAWRQSGLDAVVDHLVTFLVHEKEDVLCEAMERRARTVVDELRFHLELELRSHETPLEDLEEKCQVFDAVITEAEEKRQAIADQIEGDHRRVNALLEAEAGRLRESAIARLDEVAFEALRTSPQGRLDEQAAIDALAAFIPDYFSALLAETTALVDGDLAARLQRHQDQVDGLVESVRQEAATLFAVPTPARPRREIYVVEREPFWVLRKHWGSVLSPVGADLIERAMPSRLRARRMRARLTDQIERLALYNVENLRWATRQNIDAAFRRFKEDLDTELDEAVQVTGTAVRTASARRDREIEETAGEITRLKDALALVAVIQG